MKYLKVCFTLCFLIFVMSFIPLPLHWINMQNTLADKLKEYIGGDIVTMVHSNGTVYLRILPRFNITFNDFTLYRSVDKNPVYSVRVQSLQFRYLPLFYIFGKQDIKRWKGNIKGIVDVPHFWIASRKKFINKQELPFNIDVAIHKNKEKIILENVTFKNDSIKIENAKSALLFPSKVFSAVIPAFSIKGVFDAKDINLEGVLRDNLLECSDFKVYFDKGYVGCKGTYNFKDHKWSVKSTIHELSSGPFCYLDNVKFQHMCGKINLLGGALDTDLLNGRASLKFSNGALTNMDEYLKEYLENNALSNFLRYLFPSLDKISLSDIDGDIKVSFGKGIVKLKKCVFKNPLIKAKVDGHISLKDQTNDLRVKCSLVNKKLIPDIAIKVTGLFLNPNYEVDSKGIIENALSKWGSLKEAISKAVS
ncbi:MAG: hypothetical protein ACTSXG_02990 [Alphaproteobacteria bacterium]